MNCNTKDIINNMK